MRLRPNSSLLEGTVLALRRCADGVGAELDLKVHSCQARQPGEDFIAAEPGDQLTVFAAVPEAVSVGRGFLFQASVLGGPDGQRIVVSQARALT